MKRFSAWIAIFVVVLSVIIAPASASDRTEDVIDLGDGFYMTEVTIQQSYNRGGDIVTGYTTGTIYHNSTFIGTAELWGAFDISGATAKAMDSSISGTGYNGGSYTGGTSNCSRNTVSGTAYFTYNGMDKIVRLSLTCSPNGTLS